MNKTLSILFFEDYFVCTILPNESAWEMLSVNGSEKMLLYFYVHEGRIRNDNFAKERYEANDRQAFGDFYETILSRETTFQRFDLKHEPINLLKDLTEEIKSVYSDRIISFIPDFNIHVPIALNLCFIPGISREAKTMISSYFITEGFVVNSHVDYFDALIKILQRKGIIASKLNLSIVESYFGDLFFHYIEYNDKILKKESEVLIGKGIDHRVGNLAKLMVEAVARRTWSRILNDPELLQQEIKKNHRRANIEIHHFNHQQLDIKLELSDFSSARVIIDQRELDKISAESFQYIKFRYESFISKHSNLARTEKILLNGPVLTSDIFTKFFQATFGSGKIIAISDFFIESLSRGVFSVAPDYSQSVSTEQEIEIKITLSQRPQLPPVVVIRENTPGTVQKPYNPEIPNLPPAKKTVQENAVIKQPPILPPGKNINKKTQKENKPKLPETKNSNPAGNNVVALPPLPPKKNNSQ
jgi:hypothetical protein